MTTQHVPGFRVSGTKGGGEEAASSEGSGSVAESVRPMVSSRGAPPVMPQAAPGDSGLRRTHRNGYSHHGGNDSDDDDDDDDDGAEVPDMPAVARKHVPKDLQQYDPFPGPNKVCPVQTITIKVRTTRRSLRDVCDVCIVRCSVHGSTHCSVVSRTLLCVPWYANINENRLSLSPSLSLN